MTMAVLPTAYVKHRMPGRVRLKIPAMRGDDAYFELLAETLAGCEQIRQLQLNPPTASLLVLHDDAPFEAIAEYAVSAGLFAIAEGNGGELPALDNLSVAGLSSLGVSQIDQQLNQLSAGRLDLRSLFFLGFVGLTVHQAAKGHIMSPASTFFWRALELLNSKNENMFSGK